jgi:LmbE family N-acetylglucosaminyl deacetylase
MNILVIAPHPDDEAIGCGGSILLHVKEGDRVAAVFLTSGELGLKHLAAREARKIREGEGRRAGRILGLSNLHFLRQPDWYLNEKVQKAARVLAPVMRAESPAMVYVPHPLEWHPDHRAALRIVRLAVGWAGISRPQLRGYEVWTPLGEFDEVNDISKVMTRKLRALRCHASQFSEFNYARAVKGLNQYRGELAGRCAYAEVFQKLR